VLLLIAVFHAPVAYSANWNPLADTGQSICFDDSGHELVPCPASWQPFYGQDASYWSEAQPNFQDNGDGTVTDLNSTLMWLQGDDGLQRPWDIAGQYCTNLPMAGHTDWRLPSLYELISLYYYGSAPTSTPFLSSVFTPSVKFPSYWSSTSSVRNNGEHWAVWYNSMFLDDTENDRWVLCVRGNESPLSQYTDNGNSITDNVTKLTWQKADDRVLRNWEDALAYCEVLQLDSETDWRMPNLRELQTTVDYTSSDPTVDTAFFSALSVKYWTSTTYMRDVYDAYMVDFNTGKVGVGFKGPAAYLTRCVRSGLVKQFHLSVLMSGTGSGSVQGETVPAGDPVIDCGSTCSNDLPRNEVVSLTATTDSGSSFVRWAGDFVGATNCEGDTGVCSLQMLEDTLITAYFMPHMQLTVSKDGLGAGLVVSSPAGIVCGDDCDQHYVFNTEVTLTATATPGSSFWYWSGEGCSGNGECTVSMDRARNVTATFRSNIIVLYLLEATKSGTGAGNITSFPEGIDCGDGDCAKSFPADSEVTLTASAESGSIFSGWKGFPCSGTSPTCVVTMNHAWAQDAEFTEDTTSPRELTVTIQDDALGHSGSVKSKPGGIDCGTDCTELYPYKETVKLTATPGSDAVFVGWSGACTGSDSCTVYMTTSRQVTANFGPAPFNKSLTVTKDGNGLGTVTSSLIAGIDCGTDCSEIYPQNTEITLIATPAVGRNFLGWSGGGCSGTGDCQITLLSNTTVNATFEMDPAMEAVFEDGFEAE